jgi:hypothetical protein
MLIPLLFLVHSDGRLVRSLPARLYAIRNLEGNTACPCPESACIDGIELPKGMKRGAETQVICL